MPPIPGRGVSERPRLTPTSYPRRHSEGVRMGETTQATRAKGEFFSAGMHMFHVTGFPPPQDVLTRKADAPPGARLEVWRTDPASDRHIPDPGAEGVAFGTPSFSVVN